MKLFQYTNRQQISNPIIFIISLFVIWGLYLWMISLFAAYNLPLSSKDFLGGGLDQYIENPLLYGLANFDGEHYISIAQHGYQPLTHAFFPLYPLSIKFASFLSKDFTTLVVAGVFISYTSFFIGLFMLFKLLQIDFSQRISLWVLTLLILFPMSFYFSAVYTESLFFCLTISSCYFYRKEKYILSGILGGLAAATRVVGIFLFPAFIIEMLLVKKKVSLWLCAIPFGFIAYLVYLYLIIGNPLAFYNELSIFGIQRQGSFVMLPQVFFRYLKIITTIGMENYLFWVTLFELVIASGGLILILKGFKNKIRISYLIYTLLSFILPTFTGSFSSLPRYILTLFPLFILLGINTVNKSIIIKLLILISFATILFMEKALFMRGYWVA